MSSFTAKIALGNVTPTSNGTQLSFYPNYANGVNEEWASSTPTLNLAMTVTDELVEKLGLEPGQKFTLTFTPDI